MKATSCFLWRSKTNQTRHIFVILLQPLNTLNDGQIQMHPTLRASASQPARIRRLRPHPCARFAESNVPVRQHRRMEHRQWLLCGKFSAQGLQHEGVVYPQRTMEDETNGLASDGRSARSRLAYLYLRPLFDGRSIGRNTRGVSPNEIASGCPPRHRQLRDGVPTVLSDGWRTHQCTECDVHESHFRGKYLSIICKKYYLCIG